MDAQIVTFKRKLNYRESSYPLKFQIHQIAQDLYFKKSEAKRGLPFVLRQNHEDSHNHCLDTKTLFYLLTARSRLQLLLLLRQERSPHQRHLAGRPKNARSPNQSDCLTLPQRPTNAIYELSENCLAVSKSAYIPPIGSSGTPIFSGRDARHSDLPWGDTRGWGRSLGLVKNGLFRVKVGHFLLYKGRRGSDLLRAQTRGSTARVIRRVFTVHTSAECV